MKLSLRLLLIISLLVSPISFSQDDSKPTPSSKRSWVKRTCAASLALAVSGTVWFMAAEPLLKDLNFKKTSDFESVQPSERLDVFVVGDSLSCGSMAYGNFIQTLGSTRMPTQCGWAINVRKKEVTLSPLFERLSNSYPTQVTVVASSGAYADGGSYLDRTIPNILGNISNFSTQVDALLARKTFPNIIIIWIGHNNLDWAYDLKHADLGELSDDEYLESIPELVVGDIENQLLRINQEAAKREQATQVVVYGLVDFAKSFKAREEAIALREKDPSLYPHFEVPYTNFPSVKPENQATTVELGKQVNAKLRERIGQLDQELGRFLKVRFSNATYTAPLGAADRLHPRDGFHLSTIGHNVVAEAIFADIKVTIEDLNVPKRK